MDNVVELHPKKKPPPRARISVVDADGGEFVVGIDYENGDYILAGAYADYAEALDAARIKGRALGLQVVDFVGAGDPGPGAAA